MTAMFKVKGIHSLHLLGSIGAKCFWIPQACSLQWLFAPPAEGGEF